MSRTLPSPSRFNTPVRLFPTNPLLPKSCMFGETQGVSQTTALNVEFVAKPGEAHKVQTALPAAIKGALGEVAGFAGGFVLIASYEARLVTVVTLWTGEDRLQRCSENVKWIRALLNPYADRWLRMQTLSAHFAEAQPALQGEADETTEAELLESEGQVVFAA
jgi:hypothetical protein